MSSWPNRIAMLWAGIVLGGSLIAAPAKFQVTELTLPVALQVGRAQFFWVAVGEGAVMLLAFVLWLATKRAVDRRVLVLLAFAAVLFLLQHLALMPPLQQRSEIIIAGGEPQGAPWHLVYVSVEILKVAVLVAAGVLPTPSAETKPDGNAAEE